MDDFEAPLLSASGSPRLQRGGRTVASPSRDHQLRNVLRDSTDSASSGAGAGTQTPRRSAADELAFGVGGGAPGLALRRMGSYHQPATATASLRAVVFNMTNAVIGAGTLALPNCMKLDGVVPGVGVIVLVALLANLTTRYLTYCVDALSADSYSEIGRRAVGKWMAVLVDCTIALQTFGICTSYVVIAGDLLPRVLTAAGAGHYAWSERAPVSAIVCVALFLPLSTMRSLDKLKFTSAASIALVMIFSIAVAVVGATAFANPAEAQRRGGDFVLFGHSASDFLQSVPVLAFAFVAHSYVPILYRELRWSGPPSLDSDSSGRFEASGAQVTDEGGGGRMVSVVDDDGGVGDDTGDAGGAGTRSGPLSWARPLHGGSRWPMKRRKLATAINVSHIICVAVYTTVAVFGYQAFRGKVSDDVLSNFDPKEYPFAPYLQLAYALVILFSFPVMAFACRESVHQIVLGKRLDKGLFLVRLVEATAIVGLALLLALKLNLTLVFGLTGSLCAVNVMYVYPSLFYLRVRRAELRRDGLRLWNMDLVLATFTLVFGLVVMVVATGVTLSKAANK